MAAVMSLETVIAERHFSARDSFGAAISIVVRVGLPTIDTSGENWMCPYEVAANGHSNVFAMHGVDSMQALELTLRIVETEASLIALKQNRTLRWLDAPYTSMFASSDQCASDE